MNKIVVIGGGTMGLDIAQVFAKEAFDVVVRDISEDLIAASASRLRKGLDKLVAKGKISEDNANAILSKIKFTVNINEVADADLVIEAAVENLTIKKQIFAELDGICKTETILATNTSSISITAIASATKRADRFIGMHFFNPATVMKLIEVIRGANTSDETFKIIYELSLRLGKTPIEVAEAPGFVVNKLLVPMINEAACLVELGIASIKDIDTAMCLGANHPMGPLALGDFIGLDVCLSIMDTLYSETGDNKYRASLLLRKMVRGGLLGKKAGKGFYNYDV